MKTKFLYNEILALEIHTGLSHCLEKNMSQKIEIKSVASISVCESMINRYLSLKSHGNYNKIMG